MKKIFCFLIILQMTLTNCSSKKQICNENAVFKKALFENIDKVENYTLGKGHREDFDSGLQFLSKYVIISYDDMLNYNKSYTSYEAFLKDKAAWLKWYDEKKCSNIQMK